MRIQGGVVESGGGQVRNGGINMVVSDSRMVGVVITIVIIILSTTGCCSGRLTAHSSSTTQKERLPHFDPSRRVCLGTR